MRPKKFDPSIHHAMTQIAREDLEEKMVAEELRPGYRYRDKVLRPSLVAVSIKPQKSGESPADSADTSGNIKINIHENVEED
jgi:hypothetical protein